MIDSWELFKNDPGGDNTMMKDGSACKRDIFMFSTLMSVF